MKGSNAHVELPDFKRASLPVNCITEKAGKGAELEPIKRQNFTVKCDSIYAWVKQFELDNDIDFFNCLWDPVVHVFVTGSWYLRI